MDDLYRFIHAWAPTLYGELDENYWRERGYILSDTDTDLSPELSPHETGEGTDTTEEGKSRGHDGDDISDLTRESWEVSIIAIARAQVVGNNGKDYFSRRVARGIEIRRICNWLSFSI